MTDFRYLARRQISETIARYPAAATFEPPRDGWIAAIRKALDMTIRQYAARLEVSPSNVVRMEQRERNETISLAVLRKAAEALDADLVYAVIPRQTSTRAAGETLLDALIHARAREVATAEVRRVGHTMALENQSVSAAEMESQIAVRTEALAAAPRRLWDSDVTE
jgi:predicted DNA-binding mobile mystery protein A